MEADEDRQGLRFPCCWNANSMQGTGRFGKPSREAKPEIQGSQAENLLTFRRRELGKAQMSFAARQKPADGPYAVETGLVAALNEAAKTALSAVPAPVMEHGVRKWLRPDATATDADLARLFTLAATLSGVLHLFAPSLSGARPIDRLARAAAVKGGFAARAMAALAGSKFTIFHVEAWGDRDLAKARDCVSGATFDLVSDSLDPILASFDVATRLCPLGDGVYWPMGPMVPVGPHGEGRAARFPTRPGKGLINEGHVAALLFGEYVRAGAPFGMDFGLRRPKGAILTYTDKDLDDWALGMRERGQGPEPSGEWLSRLRSMASALRLAVALSCSVELAQAGVEDGAAIYRAAGRGILQVLSERLRIGSNFGAKLENLRQAVESVFGPKGMPEKVAALFDALMREVRPASAGANSGDEELQRVIERIRALRQKTVELGCTEQEALRAAEKVAELLERYGLTLSEVELRKQTCEGFGFDTGRKQTGPIDEVFRSIAYFCDCRMWSETSVGGGLRQVFFGLPADVEAARCLKDLAIAAFATETQAFKRSELYRDEPSPGRRAMVKSFEIGLGGGISNKLFALKAEREKAASRSTGRDLMIVKRSIVDEEMEKLGMSFRTKAKRRKRVIVDAYKEGVAAAHRFEVNEKIG